MTGHYFELRQQEFEERYGVEAVYFSFSAKSSSLNEETWLNSRVGEMQFFGEHGRDNIWTIVDEEMGALLVCRGIAFQKRLGFLACRNSGPEIALIRLSGGAIIDPKMRTLEMTCGASVLEHSTHRDSVAATIHVDESRRILADLMRKIDELNSIAFALAGEHQALSRESRALMKRFAAIRDHWPVCS
jgi:hypothetical protein